MFYCLLSIKVLKRFISGLMMSGSISKADIFFTLLKVSLCSVSAIITAKLLMKHLDPTNKKKTYAAKTAKELLDRLGIKGTKQLTEYELMIANHLVDPKSITVTWNSIGGLGNVIQEIQETVILPIKWRELSSNSQLIQPPKGVLLHGPPGCGKTMIAKATAKEAGTNFINLDLSLVTDKWYGESQKLASAVFSLAVKLQPCIIFIDEIDSFLRDRSLQDHEVTAMIKALFMTLWDGLNTDPWNTVMVMGATNRPHDIDNAILRRMPAIFHIPLPTLEQRRDILRLVMSGEPLANSVELDVIAANTEGFSGSDLKELCRNASLYRLRDYVENSNNSEKLRGGAASNSSTRKITEDQELHNTLRQITIADLTKSLKKMRENELKQQTFAT